MNTIVKYSTLAAVLAAVAKWQWRLLIVVAVLVCSAWVGVGSIMLLVLLYSRLGCPPTMDCPERSISDCSSWNTFIQPTDRVCDSAR